MTLHGNVAGAVLLPSQRSGTPHPLERSGAASRQSWQRNGGGFSHGVGTPRDPLSFPTLFSKRRLASARHKISGPGSPGSWISGREDNMPAWWGTPGRKGLPERLGPPQAVRSRTMPWPGVITTQCCLVSSDRPSFGQPTGRGEGVSSQMINAPKPGDWLQRSSGRSTQTYVSPLWRTPCAQP